VRARRPSALVAALTTACLVSGPAAAAGGRLRIPQVGAALSGREVRVEADLAPGLPEDVGRRLASGLPTTVVWEIRLFVLRRNWFDGLRDERRFGVTATYRPVSGDYAVERRLDGRLLETVVVPAREEAERALSHLSGIPCFTMGPHVADKPLFVRVRALYGTEVALGFVPTRAMTDWRRSPVFTWTEAPGAP